MIRVLGSEPLSFQQFLPHSRKSVKIDCNFYERKIPDKISHHKNNIFIFKVAWVRVDTQTILTIHNSIITRNQRVSLSHREHKEWKLHISNAQEVDRGYYMCQVNTDPMRSRRGYLEVQGDHCTSPPSPALLTDVCLSAAQYRGRAEF